MRQPVQTSSRRAIVVYFLTVALTFTLAGCDRRIGYGVVLWSLDENAIASGSVVPVVSQSEIQDSYTIRDKTGPNTLEIARWRVRFFETQEEAASSAQEFEELATVYGRSARNALPMRSAAELKNGNIVYRLREGEVVKLIGREAEQTDLSGLVSYWYTALTETGIEAYVFGYELSLFDPTDPDAEFADSSTADPLMQLLLGSVWRPVYFVDMIRSGAYDLDLFQERFGMFPDPDLNTLELVLPYHSTTFEYDAITNVGPRKYIAEGTDLQLTFNRGDELSLQYQYNGRQYILAMQRVEGAIEDYMQAELDRRANNYQLLLDRGPAFSSGSYGRITLLEEQRFIWTGYERLVPAAIPSGLGTGGRLMLDLYLAPELAGQFDGAVSFKFDGNPDPVSFIYSLVPDGIRMIYVPQSDIDDFIVTGSGVSSITLFFTATGG